MPASIVSLLLIMANVVVSYYGFRNTLFTEKYLFEVEKILLFKEYRRLVTSGFLHINWLHLIINMFSLYFVSGAVEMYVGSLFLLLIYFVSLVGGNLMALYIYRAQPSFRSVGASGAVCGVIFSFIALFPDMRIGMFPLPIYLPAWIYGLVYVLYAIYGIGAKKGNIGHAAHLGGALVGLAVAILIHPSALLQNYWAILIISLPCAIFLYLIATRPHLLLMDNMFSRKKKKPLTIDQRYNEEKIRLQTEIDAILEKIHRRGINSLSRDEKEKLERYAQQKH